jgi:hypothetical protein
MGLKEFFAMVTALAQAGASPAVQQLVIAFFAKQQGVSQEALNAFLKAEQQAAPPKE